MIAKIGIVVFDGVERLDVEGPCGVFGWIRKAGGKPPDVRILSKDGHAVRDHLLEREMRVDGATTDSDAGDFDLLLIPGGNIDQFGKDPKLTSEIMRLAHPKMLVASICTGAFLMAKAGLANGKTIATHWQFHARFMREFPQVLLAKNHRYFKDGRLWSSAGISAGIDMTLRLVAAEWNPDVAKKVQGFLEYFPETPYTRQEVATAFES